MEWKNIYRGFVMGTSDVVPGVSGGTIAVLLGIYDQLIEAISALFTKKWRQSLMFLIPLAIGAGSAILAFSKVINYLLEYYSMFTFYFFIGLILGILPYLFRESNALKTFKWQHIALLIIGVIIIVLIPTNGDEDLLITDRSMSTYFFLFISGVVASAAMILPGISGSLVLLVLGSYGTILHAVEHFEFSVLVVVAIGIFLGIISISNIIKYFLHHFHTATFALIIGFVIGSIYVIFPGWPLSIGSTLISLLIFLAGLTIATILGRIEYE
ncbi:MAG TPA: DUF368 domain-containing protein [Pseudogracilibacillus sp.]|nr:DUF368 domain-containing protein [Pseudogracilibacillus sp.]